MKKQHKEFIEKLRNPNAIYNLTSKDKEVLRDILATYEKQNGSVEVEVEPVIRHRWFISYEVVLEDNTTKKRNITKGTDTYLFSNRDMADVREHIDITNHGVVNYHILNICYLGSGTIKETIGE